MRVSLCDSHFSEAGKTIATQRIKSVTFDTQMITLDLTERLSFIRPTKELGGLSHPLGQPHPTDSDEEDDSDEDERRQRRREGRPRAPETNAAGLPCKRMRVFVLLCVCCSLFVCVCCSV